MAADQVDVSTYVIVRDGCPLRFVVLGSGQVEVTCGEPRDGCQLLLDAAALRAFLAAGSAALAEMDTRYQRENADPNRALDVCRA